MIYFIGVSTKIIPFFLVAFDEVFTEDFVFDSGKSKNIKHVIHGEFCANVVVHTYQG